MKRLGITGHRPHNLPGGFDVRSPENLDLARRVTDAIERFEPDSACTGMALGADQIFAAACVQLGVPFVAFLPCRNQDTLWRGPHRLLWHGLLLRAAEVRHVHDGSYFPGCMHMRNQAMIDWLLEADHARLIAVWDGHKHGGTWDTVRRARGAEIEIEVIEP